MKLSFKEIEEKLHEAIKAKMPPVAPGAIGPYCEIEEVWPTEFVYEIDDVYYKAPYKIEGEEVIIGEAIKVEEKTEYVPIFSTERLFAAFKENTGAGTVIRTGKLFEAGDFPDKNIEFDVNDLERAVAEFKPVENDLEHASTILDGHLGKLQKVWRRGTELFGEVELPAWLDQAIGDEPIKVSLAFNKAKKIVGNALVLRPRIEDAAIMSAFSVSQTSNKNKGQKPGALTPMKLKDAIKHLFGLDKVEDLDQEVTLPEVTVPDPITEPEVKSEVKPEPEFKADPRVAAIEAQLLKERAYNFADDIIRSRKALPAQRDQIAAMFSQACKSDAGSGALFSLEKGLTEGAQVKGLRDFFAASPSHSLSGEAFVDDAAVLLFGAGKEDQMSKDRKAKLLGMSALGRKIEDKAGKGY